MAKKASAKVETVEKETVVPKVNQAHMSKEEKSKLSVDEIKQLNEHFDILEYLANPDKVIQGVLVGFAMQLLANSYIEKGETELLYSVGTILGSFVAGLIVAFRINSGNNGANSKVKLLDRFVPSFDVMYLIMFPVSFSLLFAPHLAVVNTVLTLTYIDIPFYLKLVMQMLIAIVNVDGQNEKYACMIAVVINYATGLALAYISQKKSFDDVEISLFSILLTNIWYLIESETPYFVVLKYVSLSFVIGIWFSAPLASVLNGASRKLVCCSFFLASFVGSCFYFLTPVLGENPLHWLLNFLTANELRKSIVTAWLAISLVSVPTLCSMSLSLNTSRKVWHFLVLVVTLPALHYDRELVQLALAGVCVVFCIVEYLRRIGVLGSNFDTLLRSFADSRDKQGPIIVSYIYLIVGVSMPILINNSIFGLISLGLGDSMASIVGRKFGKRTWTGTSKTYEGTVAFVLVTFAISAAIKYLELDWFHTTSYANIFLICFISGVLEGNSSFNDNMLIPAFMLVLEQLV